MASNPLANYIGRVKTKTQKELSARQQQITQWQKALDALYSEVERLVSSEAKITFKTTQLREADLGIYEIRTLVMDIGPVQVTMAPRGTIIIGAQGRVDMRGPRGSIRMMRIVQGRKDRWMMALNPDNPKELEALTASTLAWAFQYVIEGPHAVIPRANLARARSHKSNSAISQ